MKPQFEKQHALVTFNTSGTGFMVHADKLHITSVLYNLIDNALKYSNPDPVISISLNSKDNICELVVSDKGIGIAEEYRGKIFDKFFRVPTGNIQPVKGYGLGLSYVAEIIKRHMGSVSMESELGKGSTIKVKLPSGEI
jgi:signal transduction histidine kinase